MADFFFAPVADIFTPISALLELWTGIKSYYQQNSTNHAPVRFDWTPTNGTSGKLDNPGHWPNRVLEGVDFRCDIACRAKTHDDAWRMVQLLLTASRHKVRAAGRLEAWRIEETSDQAATLKTVVTVTLVWTMPLLEQDLESETAKAPINAAQFDTTTPPYGVNDDTLIAPGG